MEPLNPVDFYNVRELLSEEERLVQDSVARFVDQKVQIGRASCRGRV